MSAQHTPGPWFASIEDTLLIQAPDPDCPHEPWNIANVIAGVGYDDDTQPPANARLIAAAPELLSALTIIFDGVEDEGGDPDGVLMLPLTNREVAAARAAISKAQPLACADE